MAHIIMAAGVIIHIIIEFAINVRHSSKNSLASFPGQCPSSSFSMLHAESYRSENLEMRLEELIASYPGSWLFQFDESMQL